MKKRLLFIFLSISICIVCFSQSISVSSFKLLDTDLTANTAGTMELDQNGETAALIKVVTTQTGFTFDGGALGIVKTVQKPSEIWVYIPRGLKKISISHPQLGMLRDYYLNVPIEAARTYEMILVAGEVQTVVKQARTSQYVVFQLTPPDAVVELNGELLKTEGGVASKMMKFGTYNYRVQAPDYLLEAGSVTVDDPNNKKVVNISLKPNFAKVTINVDNNAEIWVNGEKKGEGSWSGNLGAGTYELEAKKQGHRSTTTTQDFIVTSEPQIVKLQSPTPIFGEADINSSPGMADIFIDGKKVGQTPQLISNLIVGNHSIRLEKKGYKSESKTIDIKEGEVLDVKITLNKEDLSQNKTKKDESSSIEDIGLTPETNNAINAIRSHASNVSELAKIAYKKDKKDPEALMKIARAFFEQKDTAGANQFARYANEASKPKYQYAPSYLLLGDVEAAFGNNVAKAAGYYNQAINFDPKNPDGYKKWAMVYRKISPKQAAQKLQDMKTQCPNEEVDAIIAHIYMLEGDEKNAHDYYKKTDITKLDKQGLNEYARSSYFTGNMEDALAACKTGLRLEPRNPLFNRLAMFSNYELKNYDAAKGYIYKYFNETDSAKFSEYDHFYAALIYEALGQKENAYDQYKKSLDLCSSESMIKHWYVLKTIADSYLKDDDIKNACYYYEQYFRENPNLTFNDYEDLANIYIKWGEAYPAKKAEYVNKSVKLYREAGQKYPDQQVYATYMAANNMNKLDDNMKDCLARNDYLKVIDLLANKADRTRGEDTMLKTAYHYMMFNSYINKNVPGAKEYAEKILVIDPEYKPALEIQNLK